MTAPDPGLTDLIAAHWYNTSTCMCTCGWSTRHLPESDDDTRIGILVARHLALVVEQHTNGRHEWPKTTPTGHTYERPTTYDELNGITADMAQGEIEGWEKTELPPEPTWSMVTLAQREIYRQSVRIAELEAMRQADQKLLTIAVTAANRHKDRAQELGATIANVRTLADVLSHSTMCATLIDGPDESCTCIVSHLRAALEGEQQ